MAFIYTYKNLHEQITTHTIYFKHYEYDTRGCKLSWLPTGL